MSRKVAIIVVLFVTVGIFSACGLDISETVNYANEQINAQTAVESATGDTGFNLETAITGALEDEGVSTINDEGTLCFDVPEGYIYSDEHKCYISLDSTVNIWIEKDVKDGKVIFATDEAMEIVMEESLREQKGYDVDVVVSDMEETTIDGYEGAYVTFEYALDGKELINKQVLVVGDKYDHALVFLYYQGSPYADDWDAIKESVRFE